MDFLAQRLERTLERHLVDPHRVQPPAADLSRSGARQTTFVRERLIDAIANQSGSIRSTCAG